VVKKCRGVRSKSLRQKFELCYLQGLEHYKLKIEDIYGNINHQGATPIFEDFVKLLEGRKLPQINKSYTREAVTP
jgi:hypothetical protein